MSFHVALQKFRGKEGSDPHSAVDVVKVLTIYSTSVLNPEAQWHHYNTLFLDVKDIFSPSHRYT